MKNKFSLIPFVILALATVLGCGRLTDKIANSTANLTDEQPNTSDVRSNAFTLEGKEWKSFDLADTDMKVELPGPPVDKGPPMSQMPGGTAEVFSSIRLYAYDEKDFASSYTQIVPTGKRKFEIKELADTSMGALKRQAPDLNYTLDIKSPSNAKYDGTFTRNGKNYELKGCVIHQKTKPERVWAVITVFPNDSVDGRAASQRIIDSASFAGSTEECN